MPGRAVVTCSRVELCAPRGVMPWRRQGLSHFRRVITILSAETATDLTGEHPAGVVRLENAQAPAAATDLLVRRRSTFSCGTAGIDCRERIVAARAVPSACARRPHKVVAVSSDSAARGRPMLAVPLLLGKSSGRHGRHEGDRPRDGRAVRRGRRRSSAATGQRGERPAARAARGARCRGRCRRRRCLLGVDGASG